MISNPKRPVITPSQLEVNGDEVKFKINAEVPGSTLSPGVTYSLVPRFKYGNRDIVFAPIKFTGSRKDQSLEKEYSFDFSPEMVDGELGVFGNFLHEKTGEQESYRIPLSTTKGIITTSRLLDESYQPAYSILKPYFFNLDTITLDFQFALGETDFLSNGTNSRYIDILDSLITSDNVFLSTSIIGTHSPVGSNEVNERIAKSRADRIQGIYQEKIRERTITTFDNLDPVTKVDFNSWDIFLEKLKESPYWIAYGDQVSAIIEGAGGDYEVVKTELQTVRGIRGIARDVYPKLQISRLRMIVASTLSQNDQFVKKFREIIQGEEEASMSVEDKLYVAQGIDPRLRIQMYDSLAQRHESSWKLFNDWAATYLESYHRWDQSRGKGHVQRVYGLLSKSLDLYTSSEALINSGIVSSIAGRPQLAIQYFDEASKRNPVVTDSYHYSKGVIAVKAGEYRNAVMAFEKMNASDKTSDLNYGLALLLNSNYDKAIGKLNSALEKGADSSKTQYLQAIAANRSKNQNQAVQYLSSVFRRNPRYNDYYHDDHEFENINKVLLPRYPDSLKSPVPGFKRSRTFGVPVLAYPLPKATFQRDITNDIGQLNSSKGMDAYLKEVLTQLEWQSDDISFFQLPEGKGFAILADLEQIDASGFSQFPPDRWEAKVRFGRASSPNDFLMNYLHSLSSISMGSYRLVVLTVEKSQTPEGDQQLILASTNDSFSDFDCSGCTVNLSIYEFKKSFDGRVDQIEDTMIDHYSASGLARQINSVNVGK